MNVLCIGNSFSQDATRYLHQISEDEIFVRNLYIGGCSLETHWNNIKNASPSYEYQKNGRKLKMISINDALTKRKWDYISIQQVSHFSGLINSYEPFLGNIYDFLRENCPKAKIVFHRTWAYDDQSNHFGFAFYENSRPKMFNAIIETTNKIAEKYGFDIIPSGDAVEKARELEEFSQNGPLNINRDGFHLSLDYGRYLAGLVMFAYFTGKNPENVSYAPDDTDIEIIKKLRTIAKEVTLK